MTITTLGYFIEPLSQEERSSILELTRKLIQRDIGYDLRNSIRYGFPNSIGISDFEPNVIKDKFQIVLDRLFTKLQDSHPQCPELFNIDNWKINIILNGDEIPILVRTPWLDNVISGTHVFEIDFDKVSDKTLINSFNILSYHDQSLLRVLPENKELLNYNKKINELNDVFKEYDPNEDVDYTDIIKEIIQAVKEGKL